MVSEKQTESAQWSGVLDPQESSIPIGRFPASHSDAVCGARPSGRFTVAGTGSQGWSAFVRLLRAGLKNVAADVRRRTSAQSPPQSPPPHVGGYRQSSIFRQAKACTPTRLPASLLRFIKFCLVGGSGLLVDMGILYLLADPSRLGWNITLSKICAALVALTNNFIWNELWTFRNPSPHRGEGGCKPDEVEIRHSKFNTRNSLLRRFLLFNAICGIGIGIAVLLLHLFHSWLGWNLYLSNLLAIILITLWNFGMNAKFNWSRARKD